MQSLLVLLPMDVSIAHFQRPNPPSPLQNLSYVFSVFYKVCASTSGVAFGSCLARFACVARSARGAFVAFASTSVNATGVPRALQSQPVLFPNANEFSPTSIQP